nr:ME53-like protein [Pieris rapae granulovirus]
MQDIRVQFLTKETQEVINAMVGEAQKLILGINTTSCFKCNDSFKETKKHTSFIFIVVFDYLNLQDEILKFCCLKCCKNNEGMMDVIELYPTLSLHSVKKLMYFNVIKKFFFNFLDTDVLLYKKYVVVEDVESVIQQIFNDKEHNHEIQKLCLKRNNDELVTEDNVDTMRVDYGARYNFDKPLALNAKMACVVNQHCKIVTYYVEVYYKEYEKYRPFIVYYNQNNCKECCYCTNKICPETGHPVFYCSVCGPTDPNYFSKQHKMMFPFWRHKYNYDKVYWKTMKQKGLVQGNIMLYGVDTRRNR